jgi:hypothetical protein
MTVMVDFPRLALRANQTGGSPLVKQVIFAEMVLRAQLWKEYLSADPWYANWTDESWRRYAASAANELPPGSEERYCLLAQHRRRSAPPSPFDSDQRDGWPLMADFPQTQAGFDAFMDA